MHVTNTFDQILFRQGGLQILNIGVAGCPKGLHRVGMHSLQQQYLDLILVQRNLGCHDVPSIVLKNALRLAV